jgi:hypothetical protein
MRQIGTRRFGRSPGAVAFVANQTEFQRVVEVVRERFRVMHSVVPFVQHPLENQQLCLWEAPFEIAWQFHAANVSKRRRGLPQVVPSSCRFGVWVVAGR